MVVDQVDAGDAGQLLESERIVVDTIGRLLEFLGFKRNMGRIWAIIYLSDRPLAAPDLRVRLRISSGAVSMTLAELTRWGVIKKLWIQGDRRDYYVAEGDLWKMISRVLRERERAQIIEAIEAFESALEHLDRVVVAPAERARCLVQRERIQHLLKLARLARTMLDGLITSGRIDTSWLPRFSLGRRR